MVTIKEIAKECNVSATTVSNILNGKPKVSEETRERVMKVIKRRGYRPNYVAQNLRRQKTHTIGIIAEDINQFSTPGVIESIMARCEREGYHSIVWNLRLYARWNEKWYDNESAYRSALNPVLQELRSTKVDGAIYLAGHARIIHCTSQDYEVPVVMAYASPDLPAIPAVFIDEEQSGYDAMRYLIEKGHRRIGVIGGRSGNIHTQKRLVGVQRALYEANIPYNPAWVRYGDWFMSSGEVQADPLVMSGVTAIFCMSDRMAGGVYHYLDKRGMRAGVDLSVMGFDNQDLAEHLCPPLTTMKLPLAEIGDNAARLLMDFLNERQSFPPKEHIELSTPCSLIERYSVKAL